MKTICRKVLSSNVKCITKQAFIENCRNLTDCLCPNFKLGSHVLCFCLFCRLALLGVVMLCSECG